MVQLMKASARMILLNSVFLTVVVSSYYDILRSTVCRISVLAKMRIYRAEFVLALIGQMGSIIEQVVIIHAMHYREVDNGSGNPYPAHGIGICRLSIRILLCIGRSICRRGGLLGLLGGGDRRYYRLRRAGNYYIYYLIIFLLGAAYGQKAEGGHHKGNEFFHYAFILL